MKVAIVGVGLIGGSFALVLKDKGICTEVIGVDNSEKNRVRAMELGLIDRIMTLDEAVAEADLIVLATPVDSIPLLAVKVLNRINERQVVIDMGSTKQELCEVIAQHPRRGRFVATHPMWGTEYSGPEAAVHESFAGRTVVLCDTEKSDPDALKMIEDIYTRIGMPIKYMSSEEQDMHTAYVSHISHITSFALALTGWEKERDEERQEAVSRVRYVWPRVRPIRGCRSSCRTNIMCWMFCANTFISCRFSAGCSKRTMPKAFVR